MTKSDAMNTFISEVDRIRKERQLTQGELAEILGTKQGNISRLLRGDENPTIQRCEEIAAELGYELEIKFVELSKV